MKNLNISIYIEKDKTNKKGLAPIYAKIGLPNQKSTKFSLGESADYLRWKNTNGFKNAKDYDGREFRFKLDAVINKLFKIEEMFQQENKAFTVEMVKNRFLGKDIVYENKTLLDAFTEFERRFKLKVEKGNLVEKTFDKFNSMKKKLDGFLKLKHSSDIPLSRVDNKFNREFHEFIQESISIDVSNKYLISFRQIISSAVEWEWLKVNPLSKYNYRWENNDPTYLTEEEVRLIVDTDLTNKKGWNRTRHLFLFMVVTGTAWRDLFELLKIDVMVENGEHVINKNRIKTQKYNAKANILLTQDAQDIIGFFSNEMTDSNKLLPVVNNSDFNKELKFIADKCGIKKNLTCHVARHTAGVIAAMKGFSTREIAAMLGHKNERMALRYAAIAKQNLTKPMKMFEGLIADKSKQSLKIAV